MGHCDGTPRGGPLGKGHQAEPVIGITANTHFDVLAFLLGLGLFDLVVNDEDPFGHCWQWRDLAVQRLYDGCIVAKDEQRQVNEAGIGQRFGQCGPWCAAMFDDVRLQGAVAVSKRASEGAGVALHPHCQKQRAPVVNFGLHSAPWMPRCRLVAGFLKGCNKKLLWKVAEVAGLQPFSLIALIGEFIFFFFVFILFALFASLAYT